MSPRPHLAGVAALLCLALASTHAAATPFYALNSANTCDTCHVEPIDWDNPPDAWQRECTLDCQSCHVSPTGGGMRNSMGKYFSAERLALFGDRPSHHGKNPPVPEDKRLRYNALAFDPETGEFKGGWQGGWQKGSMHYTEDDKRYGYFAADPVIDVGGDLRLMTVVPTEANTQRNLAFFPMQAQLYLAWKVLDKVTTYVDVGWQGSQSGLLGPESDDIARLLQQRLWVREAFVMAHRLPMMSYIRAGRFTLPYGWRLPDHTAYTRRGLWDQYKQGYGVEVGFAPNFPSGLYPWANLAVFRQGLEGWPGEPLSTRGGWGVSGQAGVKELGYTLGLSFSALALDQDQGSEFMVGPMWGVNLHPNLAYIGELSYRQQNPGAVTIQSLFTYQELAWMGWRGVIPKLRYEGLDPNFVVRDDHLHRGVIGVDVMLWRFLELQLAWRQQFAFNRDNSSELLFQVHALF